MPINYQLNYYLKITVVLLKIHWDTLKNLNHFSWRFEKYFKFLAFCFLLWR